MNAEQRLKVPFASIRPGGSLDLLSQREMAVLAGSDAHVHKLFRQCALAVLNTGEDSDDASEILARYSDFKIQVTPEPRGLKLDMYNAPAHAFVDGNMIEGIRYHLFAALRDVVYIHYKMVDEQRFDLDHGAGITDAVFRILRNAGVVRSNVTPQLIVCWGGHSIPRDEYDYTKEVGYQLGLRGFDIATGCGPGAMKGPMKGAAIGHAKQFRRDGRFVGLTEPDIIASESPNPIVNELVILPDIEKRLEAFVRLAHGIVVFPGGAGTAEEIMYLLGIKMHPDNAQMELPTILAAPHSQAEYFRRMDEFLVAVFGGEVRQYYEICIGDPARLARKLRKRIKRVRSQRKASQESFSFNWGMTIPEDLQHPFIPTHESMGELELRRDRPPHLLLADLRRAFSGIVAGNVKDFGIRAINEHGPYPLSGDADLVASLGRLLDGFVAQGRMKLDASTYRPCFELTGS